VSEHSDASMKETVDAIFASWDEYGASQKVNREEAAKKRLEQISQYYSNQRSSVEDRAMERGRFEA